MGIALIIYFQNPQFTIGPNYIETRLELANLLTEEMKELLQHGVHYEYELYTSLNIADKEKKDLLIYRQKRKIEYDFLKNIYNLYEDNIHVYQTVSLKKILKKAKQFNKIIFNCTTSEYQKYSFFAEVRLLENSIIKNRLNISTGELWKNHIPSFKYTFYFKQGKLYD